MNTFKCYDSKKRPQDLTYDYFAKHLDYEWHFKYKNHTIDIATPIDGKKIYELNIDGYDEEFAIRYEFDSPQSLLRCDKIDGNTLKDIWEDLQEN